MKCSEFKNVLLDSLQGHFRPSKQTLLMLDEHKASCDGCALVHENMQKAKASLEERDLMSAPKDLWSQIESSIQNSEEPAGTESFSQILTRFWTENFAVRRPAMAFTVILLMVLGTYTGSLYLLPGSKSVSTIASRPAIAVSFSSMSDALYEVDEFANEEEGIGTAIEEYFL